MNCFWCLRVSFKSVTFDSWIWQIRSKVTDNISIFHHPSISYKILSNILFVHKLVRHSSYIGRWNSHFDHKILAAYLPTGRIQIKWRVLHNNPYHLKHSLSDFQFPSKGHMCLYTSLISLKKKNVLSSAGLQDTLFLFTRLITSSKTLKGQQLG